MHDEKVGSVSLVFPFALYYNTAQRSSGCKWVNNKPNGTINVDI